jgi:cellulose synthase/poly-beta-1,6-N-acetylglucosamine synthase-like glycosyltransferase
MSAEPFVSIVVPVYNEEPLLGSCLAALKQQEYGASYEIVVVNNACTDHSPDIARAMGARVIDEPHKGVVHALRAGFAAARGEIMAATDADTLVPPGWLSRMVADLSSEPGIAAVGGIYTFYDGPPWMRWASLALNQFSSQLIGANMAMWRWAYDRIGGLDPAVNLGFDAELSRRLKRVGRVVVDRRLIVETSARRFQAGLWRAMGHYYLNNLWLWLLNRPLYYDFPDIRQIPRSRFSRRKPSRA